jgi:protocatechuate 3,4-dioxygenase beta subunit
VNRQHRQLRRSLSSKAVTACITMVVALAGIGLVLSSSRAIAQLSTAAINGTVRDTTGAVIPDAQVNLREVSTGAVRTTQSNSVGNYAFIAVPPGHYTLEVVKAGFSTANRIRLCWK